MIANLNQDDFDLTIGRLDHILSKLLLFIKDIDVSNRQTLKHHAEDMIAAGNKILKELSKTELTRFEGVE
jgi:hypothetical protein